MHDSEKLVSLDSLSKLVSEIKKGKKVVVHCHGTFDLLHIGHIKHLQAAKKLGDFLVVTLTADEFVNKGPDRPIFNHHLRADNLTALTSVDYVAINYEKTSENIIKLIQPDVYVKGNEYETINTDVSGHIGLEKEMVETYGGKVVFTDEPTFSSSHLLNQYFEVFPEQTKAFLKRFKERHNEQRVHSQIDSLKKLKVGIVGDGIIDEYHYVEALGQTGKGNFPATRYIGEERFAGGVFAVANHIAGFVDSVIMVSAIGDSKKDKKFINKKLNKNIKSKLFSFSHSSTLTKRRYVDQEMNKFFEVYFSETEPMDEQLENKVCKYIQEHFRQLDVVVIPDFGNGFITPKIIQTLMSLDTFLAVNTQVNSGNRGYHVINHYPKANYISLNEPEIRLATHDKHSDLDELAKTIMSDLSAQYISITRGVNGVKIYKNKTNEHFEIPAISTKVVDRIGAGDAYLSLSAISLADGADVELAAFIGSIAAALDVQIVCNREAIDKTAVKKYATTLLK